LADPEQPEIPLLERGEVLVAEGRAAHWGHERIPSLKEL
jgi:hypothetical protein